MIHDNQFNREWVAELNWSSNGDDDRFGWLLGLFYLGTEGTQSLDAPSQLPVGAASIPAKGRVKVTGDKPVELTAKSIIIATGARARELPGLEADGDLVWTYKHALVPPRMPEKLLVIGSGAIGIEFASFYNTLGCDTTVVEVMDRVLPVEDAEISALAKKAFVSHFTRTSSVASQSSSAGCEGISPCMPKSSLVRTSPAPKICSQ